LYLKLWNSQEDGRWLFSVRDEHGKQVDQPQRYATRQEALEALKKNVADCGVMNPERLANGEWIRVTSEVSGPTAVPSPYIMALLEIHDMIDFTALSLGVTLEQVTWDSGGMRSAEKTHVKIWLAAEISERQIDIPINEVLNMGDLETCKKISVLITQEVTALATMEADARARKRR
jgi:hypothetical protein